ncbi:SpaA isopeptide-forming pilin-related protein [Niallia sp. Man26]|uniref:SpaA isopeptide-forming pilin-related protein n=1 Tax=Niallia sp. Man26 TaxID=2912824 RepID=UPI001EDA21DB|nr:SpaA isopeptide-forming pilin-related protein [Niallia sp. Man26]UPO88206.1 LPXTG cell wall anchor domain-containing protein [Niallia sp. Man26]
MKRAIISNKLFSLLLIISLIITMIPMEIYAVGDINASNDPAGEQLETEGTENDLNQNSNEAEPVETDTDKEEREKEPAVNAGDNADDKELVKEGEKKKEQPTAQQEDDEPASEQETAKEEAPVEETPKEETSAPTNPKSYMQRADNGTDAGSFGLIYLTKFTKVNAGGFGGMALDYDKNIWTWGWNYFFQLGLNISDMFKSVGGMTKITEFMKDGKIITDVKFDDTLSNWHTRIALSTTGDVYVWGLGAAGEMGNGQVGIGVSIPTAVENLPKIKTIFTNAGVHATTIFAIAENNELWCWGTNKYGQLGIGDAAEMQPTPVKVQLPSDMGSIVKIIGGDGQTQILDDKGDIYMAGWQYGGRQGDGSEYSEKDKENSPQVNIFTKLEKPAGMGKVTDISSAVGLNTALDENHKVWQWGMFDYSREDNLIIQKIISFRPVILEIDEGEAGYTPIPQSLSSGDLVHFFIDQYGKTWAWGYNYFYGFGKEGGSLTSEEDLTKVAQQWPKQIGDGDTQLYDSDPKLPVYLTGDSQTGIAANDYFGYSIPDSINHPTIYDEKYMLKDSKGNVLDKDGITKIAYQAETEGSWLKGFYYKLDRNGDKTTEIGTPVVDPVEKPWIDTAFKEVPYVQQIDSFLSQYMILDRDGNIFTWGSNEGRGIISWGSDYNPKYDRGGSVEEGLYEEAVHEVMYMRGQPRMGIATVKPSKPAKKVYKEAGETNVDTAKITVDIPASSFNEELPSYVTNSITSIKYIVVPYERNMDMDDEISPEEFKELYADSDFEKGELLEEPVLAETEDTSKTFELEITDNSMIYFLIEDERYRVTREDGSTQHHMTTYIPATYIADNIYTKTVLKHVGLGTEDGQEDIQVYNATDDHVRNVTNDEEFYGLPLGKDGYVIGTDEAGNTIESEKPTFGYDKVRIKSYEAAGNEGIPEGVMPYWTFINQNQEAEYTLNHLKYLSADDKFFIHDFYYEKNLDYWPAVSGKKVWDDDNVPALRPESLQLKLYRYKRDISLNADGTFTGTGELMEESKELVDELTVEENDNGEWLFDFGRHQGFQYGYRVEEDYNGPYQLMGIEYQNLGPKEDPIQDLTNILITNELGQFSTMKLQKTDEEGSLIKDGNAVFELKAAGDGIILDENQELADSLTLETDNGVILFPKQAPGTYSLRETESPDGFRLLQGEITIVIDSEGKMTAAYGNETIDVVSETQQDGSVIYSYDVINYQKGSLPLSGGIGTIAFTLAGALLIFGAIYFSRRRST